MTLKTWIGFTMGASFSLALTLAAAPRPAPFLWPLLILSFALLVVFSIVDALRRPWLHAEVTLCEVTDGRAVFRVGLNPKGPRDWGQADINVLVPDHLGLAKRVDGEDVRDKEIGHAPNESVDGGEHGVHYWRKAWTLSDASRYVDLSVAEGLEALPILVKVGRRYEWKLKLDLQKVGVVRSCDLARVRPVVSCFLAKVGIGRTRRFGDS